MLRMSQVWSRLRLQASKRVQLTMLPTQNGVRLWITLFCMRKALYPLCIRAVDNPNNINLHSECRFPQAVAKRPHVILHPQQRQWLEHGGCKTDGNRHTILPDLRWDSLAVGRSCGTFFVECQRQRRSHSVEPSRIQVPLGIS